MAHSSLFRYFIRALQHARRENRKAEGKPLPLSRAESQWTRRRFVKAAALAGGAALVSGTVSRGRPVFSASRPQGDKKIAVIGGGLAGLNAAYQLKQQGYIATVYEASDRLGGRAQSVTGAVGSGLISDTGGHFINTDHVDMIALANDFGIPLFNRAEYIAQFPFPPTGFYFDGRNRSEAEVAEALRPLANQIAADAALLDQDFDRYGPLFDQLSVEDYLDSNADKIPEPYIRELVVGVIRTEYGVEANESSALQLLFVLPTVDGTEVDIASYSDEVFVVQEGVGKIIDGLATALAGQIQLQKSLTAIKALGKRFRLTFATGEAVDADYVILAIPFTTLRKVEIRVKLPNTLLQFIREAALGRNEKILAGFNQKIWRQSNGFIQDVSADLGFAQGWDGSIRQVDRPDGEFTFFVGGNEVATTQTGSTASQGQRFVGLLEQIIPGATTAANNQFFRTQWTTNPFSLGAYTTFSPGQYTAFSEFLYIESDDPDEQQEVSVGNLVFAGEHLSDEFYGFMNAGAQTGRLAANIVVRLLQGG
jgi:monoamine oxidase